MFHWVLNTPLLDGRIYGCEGIVFYTGISVNTELNPKCRTTSSSVNMVSFLLVAGGIIPSNTVIRAALRRRCCSWTIVAVVAIYVSVMQMKTISKLVRNPFAISLYLLNCSPAIISAASLTVRINISKITLVTLTFCAAGSSIKAITTLSARLIKISLNAKVRKAYPGIPSSENIDKVISS